MLGKDGQRRAKTGKDGQRYYYNPQAAKFMPQAQALPQLAQESSRYTQTWQSFALASEGEHSSSPPAQSYLLSYKLQGGVGQMRYRPNTLLYRWTGKDMLSDYQPIGNGFSLRSGPALPLLFIDNEGQVQYDFVQGSGTGAGSGWLRRIMR